MDGNGGSGVMAAGGLLERPRFEVVPLRGVEEQVLHLPAGATVTVTCSPVKGIEASLEVAERIAALGFRVVPHLSARLVRSHAHLAEIVAWIADTGTEEVFVIGGDLPEPAGPYGSAFRLLSTMAELAGRLPKVGVGAYPERHPLIDDGTLVAALVDKQRFATSMVTQICFDPSAIVGWLRQVRALGIHLPVHVGVPGALRRRKMLEISLRVGVGESARYLTKHGGIVGRLVRRGAYRPDTLVANVARSAGDAELGIAGLHINTFNQIEGTERWRRETLAAQRWSAGPVSERYGHEHGSAS